MTASPPSRHCAAFTERLAGAWTTGADDTGADDNGAEDTDGEDTGAEALLAVAGAARWRPAVALTTTTSTTIPASSGVSSRAVRRTPPSENESFMRPGRRDRDCGCTASPYAAAMGTGSSVDRAARDTYLDLLRVVAIAAVVVGHWLATGIVYQHGHLDGVDVLSVVSWTSWLTLVLQVVPVFFVVGGYANALSWTRYQAAGGSPTNWIRQRTLRLLLPTSVYIAVISLAVAVCDVAGVDHDDLSQAAWALALHLWFLAAYLALLVLTPALYAAQRRFGNQVVGVMVIVAVIIDVGVIERHWHLVGWVNYVLVWGTFHQLGFAWHDGLFTGRRATPFAFTADAVVALVLLIWWGPYPVSMIGVPGARIQNASPPSAALLAFGLTQVGIVLLVAPHARRWLQRPDRRRLGTLVEHANGFTMPVYLWHMVPLVIVAEVAYPTHLLAQPAIGSGAWWEQRIVWVALLVAVLAVVLAVLVATQRGLGRTRRRSGAEAPPASKVRLAVLLVGVAVSAAGLGRLAVQGFAPNGSLDAATVIAFAVGVVLVWSGGRHGARSGGRRYVPGETNPEEHS